jgi:hypothetical protein
VPQISGAISQAGPVVEISVGVSEPRRRALVAAGSPIPPEFNARFLVDTGASVSGIDLAILAGLGINPTVSISIHTVSTDGKAAQMAKYDVSLMLPSKTVAMHIPIVSVVGARLREQGFDGLLGRDVLGECLLVYNGPDKAFTLAV